MIKMRQAAVILSIVLMAAQLTGCSGQIAPDTGVASTTPEWALAVPVEDTQAAAPKQQAALQPDQKAMMATIDALCGAPRPIGTQQERDAALLLQGKLKDYGYEAELEGFAYNITRNTLYERYVQVRSLTGEAFFDAVRPGDQVDGTSQNVIGRQPGESGKKILVLSAHYDSTPDSIGVVDNAAGVAVVLEAARILAAEELPFALRMVLFGGEEEILIGSRQHVLGLPQAERERIIGNISVDTLAYSDREEFVVLTGQTLSQRDVATLTAASPVSAAFLRDTRVTPEYESDLVGDYLAFSTIGIDSVNYGQSMNAVRDKINSPSDTYDLLRPELLPASAQVLVDAIRELAKQVG